MPSLCEKSSLDLFAERRRDITYGQNGLYRNEKVIQAGNPTTSIFVTDHRWTVEGRIKLPLLPIQIGIDYNGNRKGVEQCSVASPALTVGQIFKRGQNTSRANNSC